MSRPFFAAFTLLAFLFCPTINADWVSGVDGDWSVGANWGGNVPNLNTLARIGGSGAAGGERATIDANFAAQADRFIIGQNSADPARTAEIVLNSGSLTTDSSTPHRIGQISTGIFTINGGTLHTQNGQVSMGSATNGNGTLNVNGGNIIMGNGFDVGATGPGTVNINGQGATSFTIDGSTNLRANSIINFNSDASGVTAIESSNLQLIAGSTLNVDLTSFTGGSDLVLFDYVNLNNTFTNVNLTGGTGTIDYAFDLGGGDLGIAITNIAFAVPEPSTTMLFCLGVATICVRRKR